jgi:hypothetical protein
MTETAESCHSRENIEARPCQFSADSGQNKNEVKLVGLFVFAFFTHATTPPFAAHWSDTEPIFSSEIKNRASVSLLPLRLCHGFSFR